MDNTQTPVGQPTGVGYSDSDFVDNPHYVPTQQAQPSQATQPSGSYSDSDFVDNPNFVPPGAPHSDELRMNDNDNFGMKALKAGGGVLEGIGEGVFGSAAGASDIVDKVTGADKGVVNQYLHKLAGDQNTEHGTAQSIGYGGETLMELMLGDEALKALPMAMKLKYVSKAMEALEKSKPLMAALKAGANLLSKATPDILKIPEVQEALKMAVQQGSQTYVKTGGNGKEAVSDALTAGTIGYGTGAVLNTAGKAVLGAIRKGGKAADTVATMSEKAANAPEASTVYGGLSDHLKDARQKVDDIFNKAAEVADNEHNTTVGTAQAEKAKALGDAHGQLLDRKAKMEKDAQSSLSNIRTDQAERKLKVDTGLQEAHNYAQSELGKGLQQIAGNQPVDSEKLAEQVNQGITEYNKTSHINFEDAINGDEGVVTSLEHQQAPHMGSEIQKEAADRLKKPIPDDHSAVKGAAELAGNNIPSDLKQELERLATGINPAETKGQPGTPIEDWTARDVVKYRQQMRAARADKMPGSPEFTVYGRMIGAADKMLGDMATASGSPEILEKFQQANSAYRTERRLLESNLAEKLRLNDPSKALNDVNDYILSGNNSLAKINTMRQIMGDGGVQSLARSRVSDWLKLAGKDPNQFVKELGGIDSDVREAFFGKETADKLQSLSDNYTQTVDYAKQQAKTIMSDAKTDRVDALAERAQKYGRNIGPGDMDMSGNEGRQIKSDFKARNQQIEDNFKGAVEAADDARKSAVDTATGAKKGSLENFNSFVNRLMDGRKEAVDELGSGKVDAVDIQNVKKAIGQDKWNDIAQGIFSRAVDNSTNDSGRFDPEKLVKWWKGINDQAKPELFDMSNPEIAKNVQKVMDDVQDSAKVKGLVKWVGAFPAVAGGTIATGAAIGSFSGPLGAMIAGLLGVGGGVTLAMHTVEWIANHPAVWWTFRTANKVVGSNVGVELGKTAVQAGKYAPGAMNNIYKGLKGTLSQ